ncbi:type IV secretion system protein [Bartonella krasnovii]|uniref:Type IV secretion system protein n=1 Tax=Bartonella krasnovii TaxID=2267275 RepID=A0ABY3VY23_9HYPH|nr:type IV secretion system protein [Bartonella krasnovii]UNF28899.1 type IV secretion system protein [Bartonella krasnovii]UNF36893.1 type IV secretion system protein [Bartonella krasnovii]
MAVESKGIFTKIDNMLMDPLTKTMNGVISNLSSSLDAPLKLSCTLYIIFMGYNIIYGRSSMPLWEFIVTTFKLGIVVSLATKADVYNEWVSGIFFHDLPNAISNVTQGAHVDQNVWDNMMNQAGAQVLDAANQYTGLTQMGMFIATWIAGFICLVAASFFCLVGFVVSLFAKLGLFLVLSIGPVFISLYMFSSTRKFTEAWLGQVANFIILYVLVVLLGGLYVKISMNVFSGDIKNIFTTLIQFLVVGIGGIFLFLRLPDIASGLASGGASLTGSGPVAKTTAQLTGKAAKATANTIAKGFKKLTSLLKHHF